MSHRVIVTKRYQTFYSFDNFTQHSAQGAAFDDLDSATDYARGQLQNTRYKSAKVVDSRTHAETKIGA